MKWDQLYVQYGLEKCNGDILDASLFLGICRKTIYSRLGANPLLNGMAIRRVRGRKPRYVDDGKYFKQRQYNEEND